MNEDMSMSGQGIVALVTGASSGIGEQMARQLAAEGYALVLVARRRQRLQDLADELRAAHKTPSLILEADLSDRYQLNGLMSSVDTWLDETGLRMSVLINNAGSGVWSAFEDQQLDTIQREIDLNVVSLTTLTHGFIHRLKASGDQGYILNVASLAGLLPVPEFAVYAATKSYVVQFSEILAHELRNVPISVTCSCPGGVLTEFLDQAGQDLKSETGMMSAEDVARLSLKAMFDGKGVYVPGLINKPAVWARWLPLSLKARLVEKSMAVAVRPKSVN